MRNRLIGGALLLAAAALPAQQSQASSHREAPFITEMPKVDGTDFYVFKSYEPTRADYVTLIANYLPLQAAYGGPNYFTLDPDAIYEIHIDNTGDAVEDITFQFDFNLQLGGTGNAGITLPVGPAGMTKNVSVPFAAVGAVTAANTASQNIFETYSVKVIRGDCRTGTAQDVMNMSGGGTSFKKPLDNIGTKTIADYAAYANAHIHNAAIPGCTPAAGSAKVFVGQRREGFAVNLGQIFDLVNLDLDANTAPANPLGPMDQGANVVANLNVTSIAIEVPAACLNMGGTDTIFGAWTTASVRQARVINPAAGFTTPSREGGPWVQVSRLGMPLVNEVVIGLKDKDKFNGSEPKDDGQFADYVTNPTLPEVLELLFGAAGVRAPNNFPRTDLIAAFLTGIQGVNKQSDTLAEMVRINTALGPTPAATQNPLGAAGCIDRSGAIPTVNPARPGCDVAGFPNGRRPGDDITDIALRVVMGYLGPTGQTPSGGLPFTDGAFIAPTSIGDTFPYLNNPRPGAP
jgi:hypothetical protein